VNLVPLTLAEANAFVADHHRHHRPVPGAKFCMGVVSKSAVKGSPRRIVERLARLNASTEEES